MPEVTESRHAAEAILRAVSRGRRLDLAFQEAALALGEVDRRWVHEAVYGTVRLRGRLDHLLDLHLRKGISSLSPLLLDLLRLGAYQLLYMDGVPSYAALSQTVDQVRRVAGEGGSRLANGVLRSLQREGGDLFRFPSFESDPEAFLSTWGSHPPWMVRRWLRRWGPDEVVRLVDLDNTPPPLFFRPLGLSLDEGASRLAREGVECREVGNGIACLRVDRGIDPARILDVVPGVIQDPGAALVTSYACVPPGRIVGDLCAAPGGKALALAAGGAYVLAADSSLERLRLLRENLERVRVRVDPVVALAQAPPFRELPVVLLDVPCSGTGTLRRHPDARWRLTLETLSRLVETQKAILEAGSRLLSRGGVLVYSTCTLEREENEEQIQGFLERNPGFSLQETGAVPQQYLEDPGFLMVLPQRAGFDGAFAARLVRES